MDTLVWHYDRRGHYKVKSGYRLLCELYEEFDAEDQQYMEENKLALRETWYANVPPKIKVFAWRLYHEILPVKANLVRRRIIADGSCFRSGGVVESISHAICDCTVSKEAWDNVGQHLMDKEDGSEEEFALSMVTAWAVWKARNDELHGK